MWRGFLGRKWIIVILALVGSFILACTGKDMAGWNAALAILVPPYIGGNVFQDYLEKKAAKEAAEKTKGE